MKTQPPPKLRTQLFSCGLFRHCTQTVLSPTAATPPPPPSPPPPPLFSNDTSFPSKQQQASSSSSSSSQSFTHWKFPLPPPSPLPLAEVFRTAEQKLSSASEAERRSGLHDLERAVVRDPPAEGSPECPPAVMKAVIGRRASKALLALCLSEPNRRTAVAAGAVAAVLEAAAGEVEGAAAERAMAALELMCTVPEGAAAVRAHALGVPVMVGAMGRPSPRERECAMSVLAVIYGEEAAEDGERAPPEEVARAVELALQGECSARGRRKGLGLLKTLRDCHALQQQRQLQQTNVI